MLSLAFLEVALRIHNPIVETVKGDSVVLRMNYDETWPNAKTPGVASESHIHQNSLGFRSADPLSSRDRGASSPSAEAPPDLAFSRTIGPGPRCSAMRPIAGRT
jgi:hypothetical protein